MKGAKVCHAASLINVLGLELGLGLGYVARCAPDRNSTTLHAPLTQNIMLRSGFALTCALCSRAVVRRAAVLKQPRTSTSAVAWLKPACVVLYQGMPFSNCIGHMAP